MEVASYSAFRYRPEKFFGWLRPLAGQIWSASPNIAHESLARLEHAGRLQAVITQNIDGLHQKAGSCEVIEVHGSMTRMTCPACREGYPSSDFYTQFIDAGELPYCPACRVLLKPGIILFEELLPADAWNRAMNHSLRAEVFIVVGSSLEVTPAAELPLTALNSGAALIINTLSPTYLDRRAEVLLPLDVTEVMPAVTDLVIAA